MVKKMWGSSTSRKPRVVSLGPVSPSQPKLHPYNLAQNHIFAYSRLSNRDSGSLSLPARIILFPCGSSVQTTPQRAGPWQERYALLTSHRTIQQSSSGATRQSDALRCHSLHRIGGCEPSPEFCSSSHVLRDHRIRRLACL